MKNFKTLGIVAMLAASLFAQTAKVPDKVMSKIKKMDFVVRGHFNIKDSKDLGDIYVLKASLPRVPKLNVFITKDLSKVIIGQGFSKSGKKIEFLTNMTKYKKGALWTVGNGNKEYIMFTDAECPYCQILEKNLKNLKKDVKIYVYLFPLSFHKDSVSMSKWVLTQKDKAKAIASIAKGNTAYKKAKYTDAETKKLDAIITNSSNLAKKLGVRGTPSVYDLSGRPVNWPNLLSKQPVMR